MKSPPALFSSMMARSMCPPSESSLGIESDRFSYVPSGRDTMSRVSEMIDYSSSQECSDSEDDLPTQKSQMNQRGVSK